jgi:hypothetical protein
MNLAADLEPVDRVLDLMAASVADSTTVPTS